MLDIIRDLDAFSGISLIYWIILFIVSRKSELIAFLIKTRILQNECCSMPVFEITASKNFHIFIIFMILDFAKFILS